MELKNDKIFTILICVFPILGVYSSGVSTSLSLAELILILFFITHLRKMLHMRLGGFAKNYAFFTIYVFVLTMISTMFEGLTDSLSLTAIRVLRFVFYSLIIIVYIPEYFDINYGKKLIVRISMLSSGVLAVQQLLYIFFGKVTAFIIPFLGLASGVEMDVFRASLSAQATNYYFRSSAFFTEPAHFCHYVILGIMLMLFDEKEENHGFWRPIFCTVCVVLTTSSFGIIVALLVWGSWLVIKCSKKITVKQTIRIGVIVVLLLTVGVYINKKFNVMGILSSKLASSTIRRQDSSFAYRVTRGFSIYSKLNILEKLFGVGIGNIGIILQQDTRLIDFAESDYMNSLSYILVSSGILGMMIFIKTIVSNFKYGKLEKCLTLYILISCLGSSFLNSVTWLMCIAILSKSSDHKSIEKMSVSINYE